MWGFAAALGPVGWGIAAIGTAATIYAASKDDYETTTYSNKSEKENEAKEENRIEKNNKIYQEIESYKEKQIKRLKDKYDVDIEFSSATIGENNFVINSIILNPILGVTASKLSHEIFNKKTAEKIKINKTEEVNTITILEDENEELIKLIEKLEVEKYETTS